MLKGRKRKKWSALIFPPPGLLAIPASIATAGIAILLLTCIRPTLAAWL